MAYGLLSEKGTETEGLAASLLMRRVAGKLLESEDCGLSRVDTSLTCITRFVHSGGDCVIRVFTNIIYSTKVLHHSSWLLRFLIVRAHH
jgi:hypothetical protein